MDLKMLLSTLNEAKTLLNEAVEMNAAAIEEVQKAIAERDREKTKTAA